VVPFEGVEKVLEIGPGMGVMTKYLLDMPHIETWVVEIDLQIVGRNFSNDIRFSHLL
jgi:16S rRNA A1518/A1519 N6-dimethyltransferase RsmA/KsgA/DIM1 with predicted DNA glycosylase/AP lyase activity